MERGSPGGGGHLALKGTARPRAASPGGTADPRVGCPGDSCLGGQFKGGTSHRRHRSSVNLKYIIGASLSELHTYCTAVQNPPHVHVYTSIGIAKACST